MSWWPLLNTDYWPYMEFPASALEYFTLTREDLYDDEVYFDTRDEFIEVLQINKEFSNWWDEIQIKHPEKRDYFTSLLHSKEAFSQDWLEDEYINHQKELAFERLPEAEKAQVVAEYTQLRPQLYQDCLKGEAFRLGCDVSDVQQKVPVLPLKPQEEESELAHLPNDVFVKVMDMLDTYDIFKLTLVCKKWRSFIDQNSTSLKRAEHAITTHLLTFTEWMNPDSCIDTYDFENKYSQFSWGLIRWFCRISENLEVLIFDVPNFLVDVLLLLQHCPKIKHLQLAGVLDPFNSLAEDVEAPDSLSLPDLETLLIGNDVQLDLVQFFAQILSRATKLNVFRGPLYSQFWHCLKIQYSVEHQFVNLVALQLTTVSIKVLEELADLDEFRVKYFSIDRVSGRGESDDFLILDESDRVTFNTLLSKMRHLEFLVIEPVPGVDTSTVETLTECNLPLKSAILWEKDPDVIMEEGEGDEAMSWEDTSSDIEAEAVVSFRDMLLEKDPNICLADFMFFVQNERTKSELDEAKSGFKIKVMGEQDPSETFDLKFPPARRLFNLKF